MQILIVDDETEVRHLLRSKLEQAGYQVRTAVDGQAAWDTWQTQPAELVIVDWNMPRMDGLELIRRIRAISPAVDYTYIILLSGRSAKGEVVTGLDSGADDYVTKPFDVGELLARVRIGGRILDLEAQLRQAARRDPVTQLLNRRALDERLIEEVKRAERYARPLALIMADLDHFKDYNDQYGHLEGDALLYALARLLEAAVRNTDYVCRYGGEEFVILLLETQLGAAQKIAETVRERVATDTQTLFLAGQIKQAVTMSLGVASYSSELSTPEKLLAAADQALYTAKRSGRNRVCVT